MAAEIAIREVRNETMTKVTRLIRAAAATDPSTDAGCTEKVSGKTDWVATL